MKYYYYIKNKQFSHALAVLWPKLRYITSKRRWYATRLGLYDTVLQQSRHILVKTRRNKIVFTIASIKRRTLNNDAATVCIEHILYHKKYRQFHTEFIKEAISAYPEVILKFLARDSAYLSNSYYQGLYLALANQYRSSGSISNDCLDNFLLDNSNDGYTDKSCLYSNISLDNTVSKLANINQIFTSYQLSPINLVDRQQSFTVTNLKVTEQKTCQLKPKCDIKSYKVTIIVTAYNARETIDSCINSLLQQTWSNLEIIVIDDASSDDTLTYLQQLSKQHRALKVIALPHNVGTFAAKSIGAQYATGEFLTCQDSDDWAHPQKIAEQVGPLIKDANLIATTSYWLRLDDKGQYYVRQFYPFIRQNPASPMFRLQDVKQKIGLWHIVRTGADSEFFERLKLIYGNEKIAVIKKPLTIASHRPNSLMTSEEFGIYNRTAALVRLDYWEAWRLWHINTLHQNYCLHMPTAQQQSAATQAIFPDVPESIRVDRLILKQNLANHKILN